MKWSPWSGNNDWTLRYAGGGATPIRSSPPRLTESHISRRSDPIDALKQRAARSITLLIPCGHCAKNADQLIKICLQALIEPSDRDHQIVSYITGIFLTWELEINMGIREDRRPGPYPIQAEVMPPLFDPVFFFGGGGETVHYLAMVFQVTSCYSNVGYMW